MIRKPLQHEIDWSNPIVRDTPGLVGWWPMVGWQGSRVLADITRRSAGGTLTNMDPSSDWIYDGSLRAMSLDFDRTNDAVPLGIGGVNSYLGSGDWTVALWALTKSANTRQVILGDWNSGGNSNSCNIEFGGYDVPTDQINLGWATGSPHYAQTGVTYSANTWYHIVMVRDFVGGTIDGYVNGVHKVNAAASGLNAGVTATLGRAGDYVASSIALNGRIADVRMYNRVLGAGEIHRLWHPRSRWAGLRTLESPNNVEAAAAAGGGGSRYLTLLGVG